MYGVMYEIHSWVVDAYVTHMSKQTQTLNISLFILSHLDIFMITQGEKN